MRKVLILDDYDDVRTLIASMIESRLPDAQIITAKSYKEAVKIVEEHDIDTFLIDICLLGPTGQNGDDFCRYVEGRGKIIMMTGHDCAIKRLSGLKFNAFFEKGQMIDFLDIVEKVYGSNN